MSKTINENLSKLIWALVIAQIIISLCLTGNQVLFNSSLSLWLNNDLFWFQKMQYVLSYDYQLSLSMGEIPRNAGILVVSSNDLWFLNYYALPRRLFKYPGVEKDADINKVPKTWFKERNIDYILLYHPPTANLLKVDEVKGIK